MRPALLWPWLWLALLVVVASPIHAETLQGTVVGVIDGDTVDILDDSRKKWRVRLAGIDAPERKQPFGTASRQRLADGVFRQTVTVTWTKLDGYGRIIGTIMLGGADVNLAQINSGMAWVYWKYLNELPVGTRGEYLSAEAEAQSARRGLWIEPSPVPPLDWRKPRRGGDP